MNPHIEWLQRKWHLPDSAVPAVLRLLNEEDLGSTACRLEGNVDDWGQAIGGEHSPLILTTHAGEAFLQSRLLHDTEHAIARRLHALASKEAPLDASGLDELFPFALENDLQVKAARTALDRPLSIITGGPGTGKTHTLARILALLVKAGLTGIRLAAPTGKAAERMKASMGEWPDSFQKWSATLQQIADTSSTLHTLLGYNPSTGSCRFNQDHPLPCDVLIVDECSMVDVFLWNALLSALPESARLILIGDPNQLESVGKGAVFATLADVPLGPTRVHLTEARRFADRPAILSLARALEQSDPGAASACLENSRDLNAPRGLAWIPTSGGVFPPTSYPPAILHLLENVCLAPTPEQALDALARVCVLTPHRDFFVGSFATSDAIQLHFARHHGNQPIIINHNDPETGLRNGSLGVLHSSGGAWFPSSGSQLLSFPVGKLPDFSLAWAITIHRSQGSEFDDVLVILPHEASPLATRELLYTAITRAKRTVYVAGDLASVRRAAVTSSRRTTLLEKAFDFS